jgi:peptidoglycan-associated lipoprotein
MAARRSRRIVRQERKWGTRMKSRAVIALIAIAIFSVGCSYDKNAPENNTQATDQGRPNPKVSWSDFTNQARNGYSDRVFFAFDQYDLDASARGTIEAWARWMKAHEGSRVLIEGHCDERGTREYNLALGARRANAIRDYLIALGVSARRIRTVSYGKERPAVAGSNEEAWAKNRRGVAKPSVSGS